MASIKEFRSAVSRAVLQLGSNPANLASIISVELVPMLNVQNEHLKASLLIAAKSEMNLILDTVEDDKEALPYLFLHLDLIFELAHTGFLETSEPLLAFESLIPVITMTGLDRMFAYLESKRDLVLEGLTSIPLTATGSNTLLRICNELLRRLSKPFYTITRGNIRLFLTNLSTLCAQSGANLFGSFNTTNVTLFEDKLAVNDLGEEVTSLRDFEFYSVFWSIQQYFSNPTSLFEPQEFSAAIEVALFCDLENCNYAH